MLEQKNIGPVISLFEKDIHSFVFLKLGDLLVKKNENQILLLITVRSIKQR